MATLHTPSRTKIRRVATIAAALGLLLTACAGTDADTSADGAASSEAVTVKNCGRSVDFDTPPERVVGYYQHPVELMLALGLRKKIVAQAYPDNDPLPQYAAQEKTIPVISKQDASFEQVIKTEPDLVYAGYASGFDKSAGRSRQAYADAGIDTLVSREECSKGALSMDDVYDEVQTIADVFDVPDRADKLIEQMKADIDRTEKDLAGAERLKVVVYDSGDQSAYTSGGNGIGNQIISLAGGQNAFASIKDTWADVSWEQVVRAAPDVIVIYDYYGTPSIAAKQKFLLDKPELAEVPAIKNKRFATLTLQDAVLGVRAPFAVRRLAAQLHPDRVR